MSDLLVLEDVASGYGSTQVLRAVSLTVPEGGITCVLGRNGVGKTTLLKTLMGLLPARSGRIQFREQPLTHAPVHARAQAGIAYVPQGREVFAQLTVQENLLLGQAGRGAAAMELPDDIFVYFPMLRPLLRRRAGMLSGGQQQQLAIARAMVAAPVLMLLDEPTEGIQPNVVAEIQETILRLNQEKQIAMLLIEQKLPFARRAGSQFVLMEKGSCVAQGAMASFSDALIRQYLEVG